jgi:hypothetical protein
MKFNDQVSFPYPVIRENSDDYIGEEFATQSSVQVGQKATLIKIKYNLTSKEILRKIKKETVSYVSIIRCRDTFFEQVLFNNENHSEIEIGINELKGTVEISSYVFVNENVKIVTSNLNPEYGADYFEYSIGDIVAQSIPEIFHIDRDFFRPLQSVFQIVLMESLKNGEWEIDFSQDKIQINVSKDILDIETSLRSDSYGKSILLNSLYFSTVMQGIQLLKDTPSFSNEYRWAEVFIAKIDFLQIDIVNEESYKVASRLLNNPLSKLHNNTPED